MSEKKDEFLSSLDHLITVNIAAFNEHQEASGSIIRATRATTPTERELVEAIAVLKAYEAWEGDLILNGDWSGETVTMTQEQHDRMLEIQAMRNAALSNIGEA